MSASIIDFASAAKSRKTVVASAALPIAGGVRATAGVIQLPRAAARAVDHDFAFWNGISGMRYVHTVYALLDCPEIPDCNIVLVRTSANGDRERLRVMQIETGAGCSNLAEVRRAAAEIGANEIHIHFLAGNTQHRAMIVSDISAADELRVSRAS